MVTLNHTNESTPLYADDGSVSYCNAQSLSLFTEQLQLDFNNLKCRQMQTKQNSYEHPNLKPVTFNGSCIDQVYEYKYVHLE